MNTLKHRLWQMGVDMARPVTADELAHWFGMDRGNVLVLLRAASPPDAWSIYGNQFVANKRFEWSK